MAASDTALAAFRRRTVTKLLEVPWVAGQATRLARRLAGRHYVAAVGAVLDRDEVLLVKPAVRGTWTLPGGWVRRREDPADACLREIREETGLAADVVAVVGCDQHAIGGVPLRYGGITVGFACRLHGDADGADLVRSVEVLDAAWHPVGTARELLTGFERDVVDIALRRLRR